jgi:hypothetical protein
MPKKVKPLRKKLVHKCQKILMKMSRPRIDGSKSKELMILDDLYY